MSKIIFITSQKEIDLDKFGIKKIQPNDYMLIHYPCLKGFNNLYNFDGFNFSVSYKELVGELLKQATNNSICFLVLWQTQNIKEVEEFNINVRNKISIDDTAKLYDLVYRLENDALEPSTEYEFIR